jgi:5,5'-dehydrodivanillate O-demethylase
MENAVDPHHTEWLHGRFFEFMARHQGFDAPPSFGKKHVKVGFDAFEWGIIKRRVVEGASEEDDDWKIGHPLVFPYNMRVGGANVEQMQIRVPIDRTTTRFMLYTVHAPEGIEYPDQPQVPDYKIPVYNEDGRHRVDYVEGQDMMAWVTQGPITDRTVEHLGRSDVGVTMLRKMFKENMAAVARGDDPLGVIRSLHDRIDLPCEKNKFDAGVSFAIDFIDKASSRFSPQADALKKLHIKAQENRKAAGG